MMKNYDQSVKTIRNTNWPYISDRLHRNLLIGGSGSGKTNVLLKLIKNKRPYIDKIYLYVKDPFESNYQLFINGKERVEIENLKNPNAFIGKQLMMFMIIWKAIIHQRKREC